MTKPLRAYLWAWALLTGLACAAVFARSRMELGPMPDRASAAWAHSVLEAVRRGKPLPAAPRSAENFAARGPVFVAAYLRGERRALHIGGESFAKAVRDAAQAFASQTDVAFPASPKLAWRFRIGVTRGRAPLLDAVAGLRTLSLVPLRDGLAATLTGRTAYLTPDDILGLELYDRAVVPPIPDLSFGTDLDKLTAKLAAALGVDAGAVRSGAKLERIRVDTVEPPSEDPGSRLARDGLREAARQGAQFIMRHQRPSGRYTYVYDAATNAARERSGYSMPRHAGTTYFLAQAARQLDLPKARTAALSALAFVRSNAVMTCGTIDRLCVIDNRRVEFGATALTALAAAELLRGGHDDGAADLLAGLTAFLRSQQRADGELMHEYDRKRHRPIDVQHMYYSGEAAMALLSAYELQRDARDLEAAKRLMAHLTGGGWNFFGARYFYGEEHWTCQAVGKAAAHMDVTDALDFCVRWAKWQSKLQYSAGQTPWAAEGALGVGPVLLPRITTASSRVEGAVPIYRVLRDRGAPPAELRPLVERALRVLLRHRWAPGPDFLFRSPIAARGGMPNTPAELTSRIDVVQHAGSAMLAWAEHGDFSAP